MILSFNILRYIQLCGTILSQNVEWKGSALMTLEELQKIAVKREAKTIDARAYKCADKRAFSTAKEANRAFTGYVRNNKNWIPCVPYKCDVCGMWHLTKRPY